MLSRKELMESLKKFSKFAVVSLASLALVGSSLSNTASAKSARHTHYSRRVNKDNYQSLVNYLNWVHRYDHIHEHNFHSYKLTHLYKYINGLTNDQYYDIESLFNKYHSWYYKHDKSMSNDTKYFKENNQKVSDKICKHILHLIKVDDKYTNSVNDYALNHYLALNWYNLSDEQVRELQDNNGYNVITYLTTAYNKHNFERKYHKGASKAKARFTATNRVKELGKQDNKFDTEARFDLIKDINNTRKHYGKRQLIVTNAMQATADYRNPKVMYAYEHPLDCLRYEHLNKEQLNAVGGTTDNWIHGENTHTADENYLINNHYDWRRVGENAGNDSYGDNSANADGAPLKYNNNTPKGYADNINDGLMNHDNCDGDHNGHRYNELDKSWKYLGVGITYDNATHMGSYNEQFAY